MALHTFARYDNGTVEISYEHNDITGAITNLVVDTRNATDRRISAAAIVEDIPGTFRREVVVTRKQRGTHDISDLGLIHDLSRPINDRPPAVHLESRSPA